MSNLSLELKNALVKKRKKIGIVIKGIFAKLNYKDNLDIIMRCMKESYSKVGYVGWRSSEVCCVDVLDNFSSLFDYDVVVIDNLRYVVDNNLVYCDSLKRYINSKNKVVIMLVYSKSLFRSPDEMIDRRLESLLGINELDFTII